MAAIVAFWATEERWMVSTDAAKLMITAIPVQIAIFQQNILFLTFGNATVDNHYVVISNFSFRLSSS